MEVPGPAGIDVRRFLTVMRRHVLLIAVLTIALGVAAYGYSASKTPMYAATAQLLYVPQLDVNNPLDQGYTDPTAQELQLQSAVTIITGPEINKRVMKQTGDPGRLPEYSVSAAVSSSDLQASTTTQNMITVTAESTDSRWAAKLANAYAKAFVDWRIETDRARLGTAQAVIASKLKQFTTPAQKATSDFVLLTERLRDLEILSATATGNFTLAVPASAPGAPFAPQPRRSAAIGVVLGLVFGVGLAFLREKLDTRLHDSREVREIVHLPLIGRVAKIPEQALAKGPLVVMSEADGHAAESIRVLRSNLQFAALGEENRVLMIMSAQKGEGKTLLTCNLAASLALAGKRVVLVDADLRRPRVHTIFGARNAHGVSSVVAGFCSLDDALQSHDLVGSQVVTIRGNGDGPQEVDADVLPRLTLLTAGAIPPNPGEMVASARFVTIVDELVARKFDYILIDSPAFLAVGDAAALAGVADGILLLVNMKMTSKPTLEEAADFLRPLPPTKLGVVTVMDDVAKGERYHYYTHSV